jgi:hypothetical protein
VENLKKITKKSFGLDCVSVGLALILTTGQFLAMGNYLLARPALQGATIFRKCPF